MKFQSLAVTALALFGGSQPPRRRRTRPSGQRRYVGHHPASHYSFGFDDAGGGNPKTGIQFSNVWGDATKGAHGAFSGSIRGL